MRSPLQPQVLFHIGPVGVSEAVVLSWGIVALLALGAWSLRARLHLRPSRTQAAMELLVLAVDSQIRDTMRVRPDPYRGFIGTLFVYILLANWCSLLPGLEPPTAQLETDIALALLVFGAVFVFGLRAGGVRGMLAGFAVPNPLMIPLNVAENITRTFSLFVRLFGNVMSGVFVVGIVLSLAGLLVPIPLMALELLTGAVQAYIFAVLAMVFIASSLSDDVSPTKPGGPSP